MPFGFVLVRVLGKVGLSDDSSNYLGFLRRTNQTQKTQTKHLSGTNTKRVNATATPLSTELKSTEISTIVDEGFDRR